jgi:hypothetical protein
MPTASAKPVTTTTPVQLSALNFDGGFSQSQDPQTRSQAVVQQSHPCIAGSGRMDICVGGQIQAVVASFRTSPASALRHEVDGLHAHQCEAVLCDLKLPSNFPGLERCCDRFAVGVFDLDELDERAQHAKLLPVVCGNRPIRCSQPLDYNLTRVAA